MLKVNRLSADGLQAESRCEELCSIAKLVKNVVENFAWGSDLFLIVKKEIPKMKRDVDISF